MIDSLEWILYFVVAINLILSLTIISNLVIVQSEEYRLSISTGDSMGDQHGRLVVADTGYDRLYNGDQVVFENDCGQHVVHRLKYNSIKDIWVTEGDGNRVYDHGRCYHNPVDPENRSYFAGRVILSIGY